MRRPPRSRPADVRVRNQNEERADRAALAVGHYTDQNWTTDGIDGLATDIGDLISDLLHLAERYGIDPDDVVERGTRHHQGDSEDGPRVQRLTEIGVMP